MVSIVKIGGKVIDDLPALSEFLTGFSLIPNPKILVHGGGASASRLAQQMEIPVQMLDGRRITDEPMLKVVVMVYAGWVNKQIVAMLQARNTSALGLSGADMDIIRAVKRSPNPIDYGFVGDVKRVNLKKMTKLLEDDVVPIVSPITHDGSGNLLNTNADTIATELAITLSKQYLTRLSFCFEQKGVMEDVNDEASVIRRLQQAQYLELKQQGMIHSGMIPKLDNAFRAIEMGVEEVRILHHRDIHRWQPDVDAGKANFGTVLMIDE
jgi:acetylglutamate kinase